MGNICETDQQAEVKKTQTKNKTQTQQDPQLMSKTKSNLSSISNAQIQKALLQQKQGKMARQQEEGQQADNHVSVLIDEGSDDEDPHYNSSQLGKHTGSRRRGGKPISFDDFEIQRVLGTGAFGKVYLVEHKRKKKKYAMKVLKKSHIKTEKQKMNAKLERAIFEIADHPFIVKLHYAFQDNTKLYFVVDLMVGGELFFHLREHNTLSENYIKIYSAEILLALEYLHSKNVIYRDLKPENILVDFDGHLKLTDFGLSKILTFANQKVDSMVGTPEYVAPEVILSQQGYDKAIDWWSFGAVLYEMAMGATPFYSYDKEQMFLNIISKEIPFNKRNISKELKSLIRGLLVVDPKKRLGYGPEDAQAIKRHPFYADLNFKDLMEKKKPGPFADTIQKQSPLKYFDPKLIEQYNQHTSEQGASTNVSGINHQINFSNFSYYRKEMQAAGQQSSISKPKMKKQSSKMQDDNYTDWTTGDFSPSQITKKTQQTKSSKGANNLKLVVPANPNANQQHQYNHQRIQAQLTPIQETNLSYFETSFLDKIPEKQRENSMSSEAVSKKKSPINMDEASLKLLSSQTVDYENNKDDSVIKHSPKSKASSIEKDFEVDKTIVEPKSQTKKTKSEENLSQIKQHTSDKSQINEELNQEEKKLRRKSQENVLHDTQYL